MHLNSLLFPAPKCSYTADLLKDELIWVPKYKRKQNNLFRLHTTNESENHKTPHLEIHSLESPRNLVPQLKTKKAMPYSPKIPMNPQCSFINNSKFHAKPAIINDQQLHNIPKKGIFSPFLFILNSKSVTKAN